MFILVVHKLPLKMETSAKLSFMELLSLIIHHVLTHDAFMDGLTITPFLEKKPLPDTTICHWQSNQFFSSKPTLMKILSLLETQILMKHGFKLSKFFVRKSTHKLLNQIL